MGRSGKKGGIVDLGRRRCWVSNVAAPVESAKLTRLCVFRKNIPQYAFLQGHRAFENVYSDECHEGTLRNRDAGIIPSL